MGFVISGHLLARRASPLWISLLATTCTDGSALLFDPGVAIQGASADVQTGEVGLPVLEPPNVHVRDERGNPVPGAPVFFDVTDGDGTIDRELVFTNGRGIASVVWTLGTDTGRNALRARGPDPDMGELTFVATAVAGPAASLSTWLPNLLEGQAGAVLPIPLVVFVRDRFGNAVNGVRVQFTLEEGSGTLQSLSATSINNGVASAGTWRLGPSAGTQGAEATAPSLEPLRIEATALPGAASSVALITPAPIAEVDEALLDAITVEVQDDLGNPIPGLPVRARILEGGGTLRPESGSTDAAGRFTLEEWRLGRIVGANVIELAVTGVAPLEVEVSALPGAPDRLVFLRGHGQAAPPGALLPEAPGVRVVDRFDNPVPDVEVVFSVLSGDGAVGGGETASDPEGEANADTWQLGPGIGVQQVEAAIPGSDVPAFVFEAEAVSGDPLRIVVLAGAGQTYAAGYPVPEPPVVRVEDSGGTPVPGVEVFFSVRDGSGSVSPPGAVTDADGLATVDSWRLDTAVGENALLVRARGGEAITVTADGEPPYLVSVGTLHLNQGNQTPQGDLAPVAGRPGVLRVFPVATLANTDAPPARVRVFAGATELLSQVVALSSSGIPTTPNGASLGGSYDLPLPADLIQPGLGIRVEIDPDATLDLPDRAPLTFPSPGSTYEVDVRSLAPFEVAFVPIHSVTYGTTGRIDESNVEQYLADTRRMLPVVDVDVVIRPVYTTSAKPLTGSSAAVGWSLMAVELLALRTAEGSSRYYHGIVQKSAPEGPTGIAYRTSDPTDDRRAAISWDELPLASATIAHEFGHNLGQRHAPCGGPSGVDPAYPTPGAGLTTPGWDFSTQSFRGVGYFDLMSYCSPEWISDFMYGRILEFRLAMEGEIGLVASRAPAPGILLWGEWSEAGPRLNPVFHLTTRATPVPERPQAEAVGYDESGRLLFRVPIAGSPLGDDDVDPSLRQFATFVPLALEDRTRLDRVLLLTPFGEVEGSVPAGAAPPGGAIPSPEAWISSGPAGGLAVEWNAAAYPVALIRDAGSGAILSFARDGRVEIPPPPSGALDVQLGEGVRVAREELRFRAF